MSKTGFSKDFIWGAATSAPQIEGAWKEGGKSLSIWDVAPEKKIKNRENCHVSCDHYHHWKEDVALMKQMGLKAYRFSISWSRIMPSEGVVNQEGLKFYSDLVDELLMAQIEPIVTIFHWDMPLWVFKKGGWLNKRIVGYFKDYAKAVVSALSDRVKWWITINEPGCFIMNAYLQGVHAPFKRDYLSLSKLSKNAMMASAEAVKILRTEAKQKVKVGVAFSTGAWVPKNDSKEEIDKARRLTLEEGNGLMGNKWWMDPMLLGKPVKAYGIFSSKKKDMALIHQPLDFIGLNIYTSYNYAEWGGGEKPPVGVPKNSLGWVIDERCMYWNVKFIYEKYKLPIMITENGLAANDAVSFDGDVQDPNRADFIRRYLSELKKVNNEGVPILGYLHWSLLDNFEWAEGYDPRFGLIYVDFKSGKRIIKNSAWYYKHIIETNGEEL